METSNGLNLLSSSESEGSRSNANAVKLADIFQYSQINYLNKILCIILLLFHLWHVYTYRGNIIPTFSRLKFNCAGITLISLNAILPCFFFVQGWLKSVEIHTSKPLLLRLHFEYLIPILFYFVIQLVRVLINNSDILYKDGEFSLITSNIFVFNSGFLSTLSYLFTINLFVDPIALIITPMFFSCESVIKPLLDNSILTDQTQNDLDLENSNRNNGTLKRFNSMEFRSLSFWDMLYCCIVIFLYGNFVNLFQNLDFIILFRFQSILYYILSIVGLILICMIFKKRPYIVYSLILFQLFFRSIILVSHISGYSRFSFSQFLASHHFLSLIYLNGVLLSCIGSKLFLSWQTPILCAVFSILIYCYNVDYYRVMASPIISPIIVSLNSNIVSLLLNLASVIGVTSFFMLTLSGKKISILSKVNSNTIFFIISTVSSIDFILR
ncbi:hypothetical protein FG386_002897 [Cryptosporidium ryanae]|uniref:uncharacterized protein n=1 Tax=Cryptosporidium ryanae TaxID=515981 RepID=UPI00351A21BE|nr:hypothetical protein FG386_002897 [Cryptosporidium ryanae]